MLDYKEVLKKSIERKTAHNHYDSCVNAAKFNLKIYTGIGQKDILLEYRKNESKTQQNQRERISVTRTKHICRKIENIYDELKILDRASVNIDNDKDKILEKYIYDNRLEEFAFDIVKYYNMIDANSFCIYGINEYGDDEYKVIDSSSVYDYYIHSGNLRFLTIKITRKIAGKSYLDFRMYHEDGVIDLKEGKFADGEHLYLAGKTYTIYETKTGIIYAFRLGWKKSPETNFTTCNSIFEGSSELFKSLIWESSELDVTKALHGIVKTFAFAPRCNHIATIDGSTYECIDGRTGITECESCKGTGMKIHTSPQDIIYLPEPLSGQETISLDKMIHTVSVSSDILNLRQNDIKELESEIVKTCFNSNFTSKSDVAKTATENLIDLKGIHSALGNLGKQISECFMWMVECKADSLGLNDIQVRHGYSLNLKLDDLDLLIEQRSAAVAAGVPMEIIKVIDYAILKKQHVDNPNYLDQLTTWEQFRPLADKSENERISIMAGLSEDNTMKVLYINFSEIKKSIIANDKNNSFYEKSYLEQKAIIDEEVKKYIPKIDNTRIGF